MAPKKAAREGAKASDAASPRRRRTKKDKDAPKRAKSSYILYVMEARKELIDKNPHLEKEATTVAKMMGDQWKNMSDAQKAPWEKKAVADKERYKKEIDAYKKKQLKTT